MSRSSAWDRPLRRCQALVGRRMEAGSPVPRSRRSRLRRVQTEVCPVCADAGYRGPAGSGGQSADFADLMVLLEGIELSTSPLPRGRLSVATVCCWLCGIVELQHLPIFLLDDVCQRLLDFAPWWLLRGCYRSSSCQTGSARIWREARGSGCARCGHCSQTKSHGTPRCQGSARGARETLRSQISHNRGSAALAYNRPTWRPVDARDGPGGGPPAARRGGDGW